MIKAIILDCWGTVFTNSQNPHPFAVFAERLDYKISDRSFLKPFERHMMTDNKPISQHVISLLSELKIDPAKDLVGELVNIIFGSLATQIAYDDTTEILDNLKKKYRLILLSNTFQEGFTNLQTNYPINDWFEFTCLSYKENMIKPNPALYDTILKQSGLHKDEVLMIGDNYHDDVLAANQVGIQAILLDRRGRYPDVLDNKIHDLRGLVTLLELK